MWEEDIFCLGEFKKNLNRFMCVFYVKCSGYKNELGINIGLGNKFLKLFKWGVYYVIGNLYYVVFIISVIL